jgi:hypothetical protein
MASTFRTRLFRASAGAALLTATALAGFAGSASAAPQRNYHQVASASDQVVTTAGQTWDNEDLYIERTGDSITLSGSRDGTADFYVDDLLKVTVTHPDGTVLSTTFDDSNGCTADTILTTHPMNIARYLQWGLNKVHLTFSDACGGDYGNSDIWVGGTANFPLPAKSLPALDGGTLISVINTNPAQHGGLACTTGFGVSAFGTRSYELTAKHCIDRELGDQSTNAFVPSSMPLNIHTVDGKFMWAEQLSCLLGAAACLLPPDHATPSADVVGFVPDSATVTPRVQTREGVLPVLGETALEALPSGTRICHYGTGSANHGNIERCGPSAGYTTARKPGQGIPAGLGQVSAAGFEGDSGGPVYTYARNASGKAIGVYALGITIRANASLTIFIPIRSIEANLAVRLLTAPPLT